MLEARTILILTISLTITRVTANTNHSVFCPSWHVATNDTAAAASPGTTAYCRCGTEMDGVVKCEYNGSVRLSTLQCMTSTREDSGNTTGTDVLGYCPYGHVIRMDSAFQPQPSRASDLTEFTCGWLNRTGLLCSRCKDRLGVAVFSYQFGCVECLGGRKGWALYLILSLVPLTIVFFVVILCDIDATAPHFNSLLCILQILIFSFNTNSQTFLTTGSATGRYVVIAVWTIVGFWNLDIFRYVVPSFCISPEYSVLKVLSLEYILALYPLLLTLLAYALIELHDKDCRLVQILWGTIGKLLKCLRRSRLNHKSSIIRYFSTFLLLSYTKVMFVSYNLLAATYVFESNGEPLNGHRLFYNASVRYLSPEHVPYFVLASIMLFVFNILPLLLLLLYPTKIFQIVLGCCRCVNWHPVRAFADKFQGCYKDGTGRTRDYRYFAGIYLLIRICFHLHVVVNTNRSLFFSLVIVIVSATMFGTLRPYKNDLYNRLDCALLSLLALGEVYLMVNKYITGLPTSMLYVLATVPLAYMLLLLIYKLLALCAPSCTETLKEKLKVKLLRMDLLFLPEPELARSYNELLARDDDLNLGDFRGSVQRNSIRRILPLFARASSETKLLQQQSSKVTYSTCEAKD